MQTLAHAAHGTIEQEAPAPASYLLTWFGSVVCFDPHAQAFFQRPLQALKPEDRLVSLSRDGGAKARLFHGARPTADGERPIPLEINLDTLDGPDARLVHLRGDGLFLSAQPDGEMTLSREAALGWETFLAISASETRDLLFAIENHWIDALAVERVSLTMSQGFTLKLGSKSIKLAENLPLPFSQRFGRSPQGEERQGFRRFSLFEDGWKLNDLVLYRPLVYYAVYGKPWFQMLQSSLDSLDQLAGYDGDLMIITDQEAETCMPHVPAAYKSRFHVFNVKARNYIDFCTVRYLITDWAQADLYSPVLYVDTDVAFDGDIEPMLVALACSGKMSAQREDFSPLSTCWPCGSSLLSEDNCDVGDQKGFCAGILGMSSVAEQAPILKQIYEVVARYAMARGAKSLGWFDQSVANYVAFKTQAFDLDLITPYVRWGGNDFIHPNGTRRGMVHLWGAKNKQAEMDELVYGLIAADKGDNTPGATAAVLAQSGA